MGRTVARPDLDLDAQVIPLTPEAIRSWLSTWHYVRMTSYVSHTSVDCVNAYTLSEWWRIVLDYRHDPDDPNEPGHEECLITSPDGHHHLLFIEVPEGNPGEPRTDPIILYGQ